MGETVGARLRPTTRTEKLELEARIEDRQAPTPPKHATEDEKRPTRRAGGIKKLEESRRRLEEALGGEGSLRVFSEMWELAVREDHYDHYDHDIFNDIGYIRDAVEATKAILSD